MWATILFAQLNKQMTNYYCCGLILCVNEFGIATSGHALINVMFFFYFLPRDSPILFVIKRVHRSIGAIWIDMSWAVGLMYLKTFVPACCISTIKLSITAPLLLTRRASIRGAEAALKESTQWTQSGAPTIAPGKKRVYSRPFQTSPMSYLYRWFLVLFNVRTV